MKTTNTKQKVADTIVGAAIGAAIAGPAGAVAGGLVGSHVGRHTPHSIECVPAPEQSSKAGPPNDHKALKRILVAVDFSLPSRRALCFARDWATRFGSHVRLVHVIEPEAAPGRFATDFMPALQEPSDYRESNHAGLTKLACEEFPNAIAVSVQLREGGTGQQIVAAAEEWNADVIIMATHGRSGLPRVLLGSTAELVVRHAPCPVLTLRQPVAG
jgi:nucleotide-binding universal stress UspA family protein